eukprot:g410.t1
MSITSAQMTENLPVAHEFEIFTRSPSSAAESQSDVVDDDVVDLKILHSAAALLIQNEVRRRLLSKHTEERVKSAAIRIQTVVRNRLVSSKIRNASTNRRVGNNQAKMALSPPSEEHSRFVVNSTEEEKTSIQCLLDSSPKLAERIHQVHREMDNALLQRSIKFCSKEEENLENENSIFRHISCNQYCAMM